MLAHLVTERRSAKGGPLDATLDQEPSTATAAVAYAAAPDGGEACWVPTRRRSHAAGAAALSDDWLSRRLGGFAEADRPSARGGEAAGG